MCCPRRVAHGQSTDISSGNKPLDLSFLSGAFTSEVNYKLVNQDEQELNDHQRNDFSFGSALPALLELTKGDNGVWYIDSDKAWDSDNILSQFVGPFSQGRSSCSP